MAQGHTAEVWFVLDSDLIAFLDKQPTPPSSTWQPSPLVPKVVNLSTGVRAAGPMAPSFLKVENGRVTPVKFMPGTFTSLLFPLTICRELWPYEAPSSPQVPLQALTFQVRSPKPS